MRLSEASSAALRSSKLPSQSLWQKRHLGISGRPLFRFILVTSKGSHTSQEYLLTGTNFKPSWTLLSGNCQIFMFPKLPPSLASVQSQYRKVLGHSHWVWPAQLSPGSPLCLLLLRFFNPAITQGNFLFTMPCKSFYRTVTSPRPREPQIGLQVTCWFLLQFHHYLS